eukprot:CAMPEP_0175886222 /NCGR_PEP_ID=MMETSP0107_2-20121207/45515_1 /TAXON_ID=195067 ORGANISM="Goniomonas pacifica, Strain CCMP1869" /NCGR_SAMPLE_ID=MMETSP0107_2 /ASSEMBLY_ACC=CAM_ASM_000203 /LENGTH=51 /DNA_ID=CAMNT_0017206577 /DNA_START=730 /DNA_END=885 /DNA_ORIENTATION=-
MAKFLRQFQRSAKFIKQNLGDGAFVRLVLRTQVEVNDVTDRLERGKNKFWR